jgi:outer membrane phospholipase A
MSSYGFDASKGWLEAGLKFRMLLRSIQPHIYILLFHGYGESMINYNKKTTAIRAGILLD